MINSMSDNSDTCVMSLSGSSNCFISSDHDFSCLLTFFEFFFLNFFCCKPDLVCYVIGTEVNRSLACRLTLIWLAIRPCLKSVITVGAKLLQMPLVSLFCLFICFSPSWLQAYLSAPLRRLSVLQLFPLQFTVILPEPCWCSAKLWERRVLYNLTGKSQSFSGSVSGTFTEHLQWCCLIILNSLSWLQHSQCISLKACPLLTGYLPSFLKWNKDTSGAGSWELCLAESFPSLLPRRFMAYFTMDVPLHLLPEPRGDFSWVLIIRTLEFPTGKALECVECLKSTAPMGFSLTLVHKQMPEFTQLTI